MSAIESRLRSLEQSLHHAMEQIRPSVYDLRDRLVAGTATPRDFTEIVPEALEDLRCDLIVDARYLTECRNAGKRTRMVLLSDFAAGVLAVPAGASIPSFLSDLVQSYWNGCWPEPWGAGKFKRLDQFNADRSCLILAALESPTADGLRAKIRDGYYDDVESIRSDEVSAIERLGEHEFLSCDSSGRSFYQDDLGNVVYPERGKPKPAQNERDLMYLIGNTDENGQPFVGDDIDWLRAHVLTERAPATSNPPNVIQ
jgi:hypothetical protein